MDFFGLLYLVFYCLGAACAFITFLPLAIGAGL